MKLSEFCIRNPVVTAVMSLVLLVIGIMGFSKLEVRFFPKFKTPVVTITTSYSGASAETMERQVSTIIENNLSSVKNVKYISSQSSTGTSTITVNFNADSNLESDAAQVRDEVAAAQKLLPDSITPPVVAVGATDTNSIMQIAVSDASKSPVGIREYIEQNISPELKHLRGIGSIDLIGGGDYAMRVWLDPVKMASYGITVTDIKNKLTANNSYFAAGALRTKNEVYNIVAKTQLKTPEAFSNIIIKDTGKGVVHLKDVATVKLDTVSLEETAMKVNGVNSILMTVQPIQGANSIDVVKNVKKTFASIQQKLPHGMKASVIYDASTYLKSSIDDTLIAIIEASFFVILVMYLFLGSWRAASIPIITIPVSLIGVFGFMLVFGFSINVLSLLGLLLAIGLVVDDAIVMLENIYRYIEKGESPLQAALKGSKEIAFSVIAMTIVLMAVYIPTALTSGISATLFKEFALTLAAAVFISGFLALTLSPMMCSRLLTAQQNTSGIKKALDKLFSTVTHTYQNLLVGALKRRGYVVMALVIIAGLGVGLYSMMHSEFIPTEDYGMIDIKVTTPFSATVAYGEKYIDQVGSIARKVPGVQTVTEQTGDNGGLLHVILKPSSERKLTAIQISTLLNNKISQIPNVDASASIPNQVDYSAGDSNSNYDIALNFMTSGDYTDMVPPMKKLTDMLKQYPGIIGVQNELKFDSQQFSLTVNRDLASDLGVDLHDVSDTISTMMGGNHWTDVQSGGYSYPVWVQMEKNKLSNLDALKQLYVASSKTAAPTAGTGASAQTQQALIPLSSLITLKPEISQATFYHFNQLRSGAIVGNLAPGYTESQVIDYINSKLPGLVTSTVKTAYSGKAAEYLSSAGSMSGIMMLAIVFIYLILVAQFGSFIDPFIILLPVPLSLFGGLLFLWLGRGTINLYSEIGLVTLIGMICKHGVLITQFSNQLRKEGLPLHEALVKAASIRLRPILMTTAVMVLGSLPLVLATGSGSIGRRDIGLVLLGGLLLGTFFSLIVVPIAYSYIGKFRQFKRLS